MAARRASGFGFRRRRGAQWQRQGRAAALQPLGYIGAKPGNGVQAVLLPIAGGAGRFPVFDCRTALIGLPDGPYRSIRSGPKPA